MTKKLMGVSIDPNEYGKIYFTAKYTYDEVICVKIYSNSAFVIVKQIKVPAAYVLHVWDLVNGTLEKSFYFKECNEFPAIVHWKITKDIIACHVQENIFIYDMSSKEVENWKLKYHYKDDCFISCISLVEEFEMTLNILVICTVDKRLIFWDIFNSKELKNIRLKQPIVFAKLIALGSLVAVCTLSSSDIFIFNTNSGKLERRISSSNVPKVLGIKQLSFEDRMMTYFANDRNEYFLYEFQLNSSPKLRMKRIEDSKEDSCSIL
jgi:hypothetical protein